jgi:hypothetical protein
VQTDFGSMNQQKTTFTQTFAPIEIREDNLVVRRRECSSQTEVDEASKKKSSITITKLPSKIEREKSCTTSFSPTSSSEKKPFNQKIPALKFQNYKAYDDDLDCYIDDENANEAQHVRPSKLFGDFANKKKPFYDIKSFNEPKHKQDDSNNKMKEIVNKYFGEETQRKSNCFLVEIQISNSLLHDN